MSIFSTSTGNDRKEDRRDERCHRSWTKDEERKFIREQKQFGKELALQLTTE